MLKAIDVNKIDPSPFQIRQYRDEGKLKELGASIEREGQIELIVVRRNGGVNYELIVGHRRVEAVRKYTKMNTILARIVEVDDLQAMRMSAAENLQREDLSAIEIIEAIVKIVDAELIEDKEYASMGKTPTNRLKTLLGKLHSIKSSKSRGSLVSKKSELLLRTFAQQVKEIFKKLPKSLEWHSFYRHDLPILGDICEEVREEAIRRSLNRSQTRALQKLKEASSEEYQRVTENDHMASTSVGRAENKDISQIDLNDLSGREINGIAEKAAKKEGLIELNRHRVTPSFKSELVIVTMNCLGIPNPAKPELTIDY